MIIWLSLLFLSLLQAESVEGVSNGDANGENHRVYIIKEEKKEQSKDEADAHLLPEKETDDECLDDINGAHGFDETFEEGKGIYNTNTIHGSSDDDLTMHPTLDLDVKHEVYSKTERSSLFHISKQIHSLQERIPKNRELSSLHAKLTRHLEEKYNLLIVRIKGCKELKEKKKLLTEEFEAMEKEKFSLSQISLEEEKMVLESRYRSVISEIERLEAEIASLTDSKAGILVEIETYNSRVENIEREMSILERKIGYTREQLSITEEEIKEKCQKWEFEEEVRRLEMEIRSVYEQLEQQEREARDRYYSLKEEQREIHSAYKVEDTVKEKKPVVVYRVVKPSIRVTVSPLQATKAFYEEKAPIRVTRSETFYEKRSPFKATRTKAFYVKRSPIQATRPKAFYVKRSPLQATRSKAFYVKRSPFQAKHSKAFYEEKTQDKEHLLKVKEVTRKSIAVKESEKKKYVSTGSPVTNMRRCFWSMFTDIQ